MIIIASFLIVATALVLILVIRPSLTEETGGKILAFVALFIVPVIALAVGGSSHLEKSKKTEFCLSCHVMEPYGQSLFIDDPAYIPANHFQNSRVPQVEACYTCHTQYTMFGGATAKLRGLKHVAINYFGRIPEELELYSPYENRECLHCHDGARSFEEQEIHDAMSDDLKANEISCLDCHNLSHNVNELSGLKLWKGGREQ
jgi:cytochrome c-type protein NapC